MEVTREVIIDLLPLYLAGEAQPDTERLVKDYLEQDSDLARLAEQWQQRLPGPPPPVVDPDAQTLAYLEAQRKIKTRTIVLVAVLSGSVLLMASLAAVVFLTFAWGP